MVKEAIIKFFDNIENASEKISEKISEIRSLFPKRDVLLPLEKQITQSIANCFVEDFRNTFSNVFYNVDYVYHYCYLAGSLESLERSNVEDYIDGNYSIPLDLLETSRKDIEDFLKKYEEIISLEKMIKDGQEEFDSMCIFSEKPVSIFSELHKVTKEEFEKYPFLRKKENFSERDDLPIFPVKRKSEYENLIFYYAKSLIRVLVRLKIAISKIEEKKFSTILFQK